MIKLDASRDPRFATVDEPALKLTLELKNPHLSRHGGPPRASADARLVYQPVEPSHRGVETSGMWLFQAPIGPIEADDIRWYIEQYALWPSTYYNDRVRRIEQGLIDWGRRIYQAAMPEQQAAAIMDLFLRGEPSAPRRFSISVEAPPLADIATGEASDPAREAANALLGLPWELMYHGDGFLFEGPRPVQVHRQVSDCRSLALAQVSLPIRILLVAPRPEDAACPYIDHRLSALPLVDAMEHLGDRIDLTILRPVTFPALRAELERADQAGTPYHVVHFDGHGTFDRRLGGCLYFENPRHADRPAGAIHQTIEADQLGVLLREHRVPLIFLNACQTGQAHEASESVASEVLRAGANSVVAMSYTVLVETARRFVGAFYEALAAGQRIGDAMLAGRRILYEGCDRGHRLGFGTLELNDWFVPVLYQGQVDAALFQPGQASNDVADPTATLAQRLGDLPNPPATGFIGRSRELLYLERLLRLQRWAVIRGQGGEGKTALAVELARWMVRSHQMERAAFVSVETHDQLPAVVDAIGRQLLGADYSVARLRGRDEDLEPAVQPIERALAKRSTLIVVDNMESILLPPYLADTTPEVLHAEQRDVVDAVLGLCRRLTMQGATRVVFTSREALPAPFDAEGNRIELARLSGDDAITLIKRALEQVPNADAAEQTQREAIERLVESVHGHARTLALLAPALRERGVDATREDLVELMAEMEQHFPGDREQSVYASIELSLRRLSEADRERVRVLGMFHGGVNLGVLRDMMGWSQREVDTHAEALVQTGLASIGAYDHLKLHPVLCPYLNTKVTGEERVALSDRWVAAMGNFVRSLVQQHRRNTQRATTLTLLQIPNLTAFIEHIQVAGDAEETVSLASAYYELTSSLDRPRLNEQIARVRDAAAKALKEKRGIGDAKDAGLDHGLFEAARTVIEGQLKSGQFAAALAGAESLLKRARAVSQAALGDPYPGADFDLAGASWLMGRVLRDTGQPDTALPSFVEAQSGFEALARRGDAAARRMSSVCIGERGECLRRLGRCDEAADVYERAITLAKEWGAERDAAVGQSNLGTVRMFQRRHREALMAFESAIEIFTRLEESGTVALIWHHSGIVYSMMDCANAAEEAYQRALSIRVRIGDYGGQAMTLGELGNLYVDVLDRPEEALPFYRQAAEIYVQIGDAANEGRTRHNLGRTLRKLKRLDEAQSEICLGIKCKAAFGHAAEPWKTWGLLADIEAEMGHSGAAREARSNAIAIYIAYRRNGGETHLPDGRIAFALGRHIAQDDATAAAAFLAAQSADPNLAEWVKPFLQVLQQITDGNRDPVLVEADGLRYTSAVEIQLLLEHMGMDSGGGG